jgi:hypothetical protein
MAFLIQSNMYLYSPLITDLANHYTLGMDKYPITITAAYNLLLNFKSTPQLHIRDNSSVSTASTLTANTGDTDDSTPKHLLFLQKGDTSNTWKPHCDGCYKCGGNHWANDPECPKRTNKPTSATSKHQTAATMLVQATEAADSVDSQHGGLSFGFHMHTMHATITDTQQIILNNGGLIDENCILLDNQSTVNIFKNKKFLTDVSEVEQPIRCYCNSGYQDSYLQGTSLPGFPEREYGLIKDH